MHASKIQICNRRKFAREDDMGMSKNVLFKMKMLFPFWKLLLLDRLEVTDFFESRKMKLLPAKHTLMCILIHLSSLLCNGKFYIVAK